MNTPAPVKHHSVRHTYSATTVIDAMDGIENVVEICARCGTTREIGNHFISQAEARK